MGLCNLDMGCTKPGEYIDVSMKYAVCEFMEIKDMPEEQKPFEYLEIKAICMMCVVTSAIIASDVKVGLIKDASLATRMIEKEIDKILDMKWSDPSKKVVTNG